MSQPVQPDPWPPLWPRYGYLWSVLSDSPMRGMHRVLRRDGTEVHALVLGLTRHAQPERGWVVILDCPAPPSDGGGLVRMVPAQQET